MRFTPHTETEVREMLATIGVAAPGEMFAHVPAALRDAARLAVAHGISEQDVRRELGELAGRNRVDDRTTFLGAGAYPHFVPAAVEQLAGRAEFATAYTPYQPEVSQGTLQATFEFQSAVAALLGMDVANAGVYDGATAAAEAVLMALRLKRDRRLVLVSRAIHPQYREVITTYLEGVEDVEVKEVPFAEDGTTPVPSAELLGAAACFLVGYPNALGVVEDLASIAEAVHAGEGLLVSVTGEALALAALKSPGSSGVDIAVGEGQSLGLPLAYGGPGLGLFASRDQFVRNLPGRLVGETVDADGARGFVLTLATREQHIRRERATSNICTNHGLCALQATVYLSLMGRQGLRALADRNLRTAHTLADRLAAVGRLRFPGPYFNEFALQVPDARQRWQRALERGVLAGLPLGDWYPELEDTLLLCATEVHDEQALGALVEALGAGS